jgi:hypothetical protein
MFTTKREHGPQRPPEASTSKRAVNLSISHKFPVRGSVVVTDSHVLEGECRSAQSVSWATDRGVWVEHEPEDRDKAQHDLSPDARLRPA